DRAITAQRCGARELDDACTAAATTAARRCGAGPGAVRGAGLAVERRAKRSVAAVGAERRAAGATIGPRHRRGRIGAGVARGLRAARFTAAAAVAEHGAADRERWRIEG